MSNRGNAALAVTSGLTKQEAWDRAAHAKIQYKKPDLGLEPYSWIVRMFDAKTVKKQEEGSEEARRTMEELRKTKGAFRDYVGRIKQDLWA